MLTDDLKILVLEDSATDAELIKRLFIKERMNYTFKIAACKKDYLIALKDFKPDVILSDHSLPEFNSKEALKTSRQLFPDIPFILVTGAVSEEFAAEIIKSGADDFILKDRMARLPAALQAAVKQRVVAREQQEALEEAHKKIEQAKEREKLAIESSNIGIYDLDIRTKNMITSSRFNRICGLKKVGSENDYLDLIHPDDRKIVDRSHIESARTGRISYEVRIVKKNNGIAWIRNKGIIKKNKERIAERIIGSIMDVTEFKYLITQKDSFIGVASHELKTPITTIKAYAHILGDRLKKKGHLSEESLIQNIEKQIHRLSSLINNLLDSSKMVTGELEFRYSVFKMDDLVKGVTADLQITNDKKIVRELNAGDCKVRADWGKIEQVITNLVNNALKFSPEADHIVIRTFVTNTQVNLEVQDFGIGIQKENLEKIFQQFYREDIDLGYTFPGLGLGLFISSEIIKRERGKIKVISKEGKGSTFSFSLPCIKAQKQKSETIKQK